MNYWTHELSDGFIDNQFDRIDPERHREISRKGGIASGRARLRKALLRDFAMNALENQTLAQRATDEFYNAVNEVMKKERRKRARRKRKAPDE